MTNNVSAITCPQCGSPERTIYGRLCDHEHQDQRHAWHDLMYETEYEIAQVDNSPWGTIWYDGRRKMWYLDAGDTIRWAYGGRSAPATLYPNAWGTVYWCPIIKRDRERAEAIINGTLRNPPRGLHAKYWLKENERP